MFIQSFRAMSKGVPLRHQGRYIWTGCHSIQFSFSGTVTANTLRRRSISLESEASWLRWPKPRITKSRIILFLQRTSALWHFINFDLSSAFIITNVGWFMLLLCKSNIMIGNQYYSVNQAWAIFLASFLLKHERIREHANLKCYRCAYSIACDVSLSD